MKDSRIHLILLVVWSALAVPTALWWRDSVAWVSFMSLYAIVSTHWAGYQAAKVGEDPTVTKGHS
jgi:hypothetical protein